MTIRKWLQLAQPCRLLPPSFRQPDNKQHSKKGTAMRIEVDLDLCQGHGMCELEAPEVRG